MQDERKLPNKNSQKKNNGDEDLTANFFRELSKVKLENVQFLWHPYIPLGKLTSIDGDPGVGKSWLSLALASALTLGKGLPEMVNFDPINVMILSSEDGLGDTIRPRAEQMGADLNRLICSTELFNFDDKGLTVLEDAIMQFHPGAIFIDPLYGFFNSKVDIHKANQTREIMSKLSKLAENYRCAIIGIRHLTKGERTKSIYRGIGSIDVTAACRSVLLVGTDPHNPQHRAMIHIKSNLAPMGKTLGFEIKEGAFAWTGISDLTHNDLFASDKSNNETPLEEAEEFLQSILSNGKIPALDILKSAENNGITKTTLYRAKKKLDIKSMKDDFDNAKWYWKFPKNDKKIETQSNEIPF